MPRALVLGNGNILANLDHNGLLNDFYFPHVGLEDHTTFGHIHRIGIFDETNNKFTWLSEDHWKKEIKYVEETLISDITMKSEEWNLTLRFHDFVAARKNVFYRQITIQNDGENERTLKIFFCYDFHLYGNKTNDTVFFEPKSSSLIFYKLRRYILATAQVQNGNKIDQYATGKSEYKELEGTWRDAEDGHLQGNPITQGSVDGTFGLTIKLDKHEHENVMSWICAGKTQEEVVELNEWVQKTGNEKLIRDTTRYWQRWVNKQDLDFNGIPKAIVNLYKQSLLIIRTQTDNGGAIIAANDNDIMQFNKDTYTYMWPRDGALIAKALDDAGYNEVTERFFKFIANVQNKEGFLQHKYNPDGSVGSSWHPYVYKGCPQSPLQEDETALPLIALWNHYQRTPNIEFLHYMYDNFAKKAGDFLTSYRDPKTGLPLPSYDLWEEQRGVFTFTAASVYGGLIAAEKISNTLGHFNHRDKYKKAAAELKESILKHLFSKEHNRFLKKVILINSEVIEPDATMDASISAIHLFGLLPANDPRVVSTMEQMKANLEVPGEIGGFARYTNDYYQRISDYPQDVPGNPWIITTLWYAQWCLEMAKDKSDPYLKEALKYISWVTKTATKSYILPEQLDPFEGKPLSVAPLTWSHATFVDTVLKLRKKLGEFGVCLECELPEFGE